MKKLIMYGNGTTRTLKFLISTAFWKALLQFHHGLSRYWVCKKELFGCWCRPSACHQQNPNCVVFWRCTLWPKFIFYPHKYILSCHIASFKACHWVIAVACHFPVICFLWNKEQTETWIRMERKMLLFCGDISDKRKHCSNIYRMLFILGLLCHVRGLSNLCHLSHYFKFSSCRFFETAKKLVKRAAKQ